jgi:hypothetical protein
MSDFVVDAICKLLNESIPIMGSQYLAGIIFRILKIALVIINNN